MAHDVSPIPCTVEENIGYQGLFFNNTDVPSTGVL
jgi:hypothetical protein